jgi:DnaK suppressor protein
MDQVDNANEVAQQRNEIAVMAARRKPILPPQEKDAAGCVICLDCGEQIAPARLQAVPNAVRCVECESWRSAARGGGRG